MRKYRIGIIFDEASQQFPHLASLHRKNRGQSSGGWARPDTRPRPLPPLGDIKSALCVRVERTGDTPTKSRRCAGGLATGNLTDARELDLRGHTAAALKVSIPTLFLFEDKTDNYEEHMETGTLENTCASTQKRAVDRDTSCHCPREADGGRKPSDRFLFSRFASLVAHQLGHMSSPRTDTGVLACARPL